MHSLLKQIIVALFFLTETLFSYGQTSIAFADSIRKAYNIPELNYAVVSSDSIIEMFALGVKKYNSGLQADLNDRFRIGSNTKTITSYIAALLVKQGKINWNTKFFELYPELKAQSNAAYYDLTLQDLLTFRANLISWTYTNDRPTKKIIKGDEQAQRYQFAAWILQQPSPEEKKPVYWSNPAYVLAGLMLEKAAQKNYEMLVTELGKALSVSFEFGQPNYTNKSQTWGHKENLLPEKPGKNDKLNWLSAAGNINVDLPGYVKFIQLQLQGLLGKSQLFTQQEFNYWHYGLPEFSFGWNWYTDSSNGLKYSFHKGNPGTFLTKVYLCKDIDKAFICFMNVQSDAAEEGLSVLFDELNKRYGNKKL